MQVLGDPKQFEEKEQLYVAARQREGRICTDEELSNLPETKKDHQHYEEWVYRRKSWTRFAAYLKKEFQGKRLNILDIGCGNGWMSHRLHNEGDNVTGLDLNITELEQAERVFGSSDTMKWVYADVFDPAFDMELYDVIVLAASCQYFPDLGKLTERLKSLLHDSGQVHLIDSKFYSEKEAKEAKKRTLDYYMGLGYPQMCSYYHHHMKAEVKSAGYKKLYPTGLHFNAKLEWWALSC